MGLRGRYLTSELQKLSEGHTNFPTISEDYRRFSKIAEDFRGRSVGGSIIHQRVVISNIRLSLSSW